jgi:hypothetical protein
MQLSKNMSQLLPLRSVLLRTRAPLASPLGSQHWRLAQRLPAVHFSSAGGDSLTRPASVPATPGLATNAAHASSAAAAPGIEESLNGRRRTFGVDPVTGRLCARWDQEDAGAMGSSAALLKTVFLPTGFPHTTQPSYAVHHAWIMSETFFTCTQYVLCHQSMLDALGVAGGASGGAASGGAEGAVVGTAVAVSAAAVAMQWVLKDGLGELGKLYVSRYYSHQFDSRPKTWKLCVAAFACSNVPTL